MNKTILDDTMFFQSVEDYTNALINKVFPKLSKRNSKVTYEFSSTQLDIPKKLAKQITDFGKILPEEDIFYNKEETQDVVDTFLYPNPKLGEYGREMHPHVTVKYGLETFNPKDVEELVKGFGAITIRLKDTAFFKANDYDVLIIKIESERIREMNRLLSYKLASSDTFANYTPHITIAYLKKGQGAKYKGLKQFNGNTVVISKLHFSGKDGKQKYISLI